MAVQHRQHFVPTTIRDHSRIVSWLWPRCSWISYDRGRQLARWLP